MKLMEKTKNFSNKIDKISDFVFDARFIIILYLILLVIEIFCFYNMDFYKMPEYPETAYQNLEQEFANIIVENDDIYMKNLQDKSIEYSIKYYESSTSDGKYTIILRKDGVEITGTIGKSLDFHDLILERQHKNIQEYENSQYIVMISGTFLFPVLGTLIVWGFILVILVILLFLQLIIWIIKKISS